MNIIQTYQYKYFILHWNSMDREKYWKVFLRTDEKYKGLLLKKNHDLGKFKIIGEESIGSFYLQPGTDHMFYETEINQLTDPRRISLIQVSIDNLYQRKNDLWLSFSVRDKLGNQEYAHYQIPLLHFVEKGFNEWQTGIYNFEVGPMAEDKDLIITLKSLPGESAEGLKNVRIRYLKPL